MSVWKRNAVVVAIVLFVGAAVYLNWSYSKEAADDPEGQGGGKLLGQTTLVNGEDGGASAGKPDAATPSAQPSADPDAQESQSPDSTASTGYFASARLNRQQARDSALELLQQAAADENAQQTVLDEANASIQAMAAFTLSEAQVENLVTAKGYGDCVCFLNENSASVVVSSTTEGLSETDIAKIAEIVMEETGLAATKITIIETEP
ncbi:MAG: SpoIIIAH-like family protein [Oscillospiraceae bacterium]|nr:SpoIIIAH-like family protein [Oscillospiraceae bacterium]